MNRPIQWSDSQCLGWLIDQLVFMEVVTIAVEVILVMRRESSPFIVDPDCLQLTRHSIYIVQPEQIDFDRYRHFICRRNRNNGRRFDTCSTQDQIRRSLLRSVYTIILRGLLVSSFRRKFTMYSLWSNYCVLSRLSSLIFETFLFILTLFVFFRNVRREYKTNSVIHVFVRDGTWAFALIFGWSCVLLKALYTYHFAQLLCC